MSEGGAALMAIGKGSGDDRAKDAAEMAISNRLLDITIDGARGILFNITGGEDMTLYEVNQAAAIIKESAHPDVNFIFGAVIDPEMKDEVRVTVVGTGYDQNSGAGSVYHASKMSYSDALFGKRPAVDNPVRENAVKMSEKKDKPVEVGVKSSTDSADFSKKDQLDVPPFMRLMSRD